MADNEFVYFLLAGLFILAALLFVFGGGIGCVNCEAVRLDAVPVDTDITGATLVGEFEQDRSRTLGFNVDVSNIETSERAEIGDRELINGLLFGKSDFKRLAAGDISDIDISFEVVRTNSLAPLNVKVNGQVVGQVSQEGKYEIDVPSELIQSENLIELDPESSLWRIWAPALYRLEDIVIEVDFFEKKTDTFTFEIGDELGTMHAANLNLFFTENAGQLTATMNNRIVFSGFPLRTESVLIDRNDFRLGENRLSFESSPNSVFDGDGSLVIFFTETTEKLITSDMELTEEEARADAGIVRFTVPRVNRVGGIVVEIIHEDETVFRDFAKATVARHSFRFDPSGLRGSSDLIIRGTEGAQFYVKDIRVDICEAGC